MFCPSHNKILITLSLKNVQRDECQGCKFCNLVSDIAISMEKFTVRNFKIKAITIFNF